MKKLLDPYAWHTTSNAQEQKTKKLVMVNKNCCALKDSFTDLRADNSRARKQFRALLCFVIPFNAPQTKVSAT